jgi:hypothetical protein
MQIKKVMLIALGSSLMLATSCKKKGCTNPEATNYSEEAKKDDGSCILPSPVEESYDIPTTYTFKDVHGNCTVSFSGPKQR